MQLTSLYVDTNKNECCSKFIAIILMSLIHTILEHLLYLWYISFHSIPNQLNIKFKEHINVRDVDFKIGENLAVYYDNRRIIDGKLQGDIVAEKSSWFVSNSKTLVIYVHKSGENTFWSRIVDTDPEILVQNLSTSKNLNPKKRLKCKNCHRSFSTGNQLKNHNKNKMCPTTQLKILGLVKVKKTREKTNVLV